MSSGSPSSDLGCLTEDREAQPTLAAVLGEDDRLIERPLNVAQQPLHRRPMILSRVLHEPADVPYHERDVWPSVREVAQPLPTMLR